MENYRIKILGLTLLLAGFALWAVGLRLLLGPAQYQATVRIKVEPDAVSNIGLRGPARDSSVYDPYFIQTESEVIQSQMVLGKVVEALNLNTGWDKSTGGSLPKTVDVVNLLRRRMNLCLIRNTKLIEISVTSEDPHEAAKLANTIADAYKKFRTEQRRQLILNGIQILTEQCQNEEEQIHALQIRVQSLRIECKITNDVPPPELQQKKTNRSENYAAPPGEPYWEEKFKLEQMMEFHELLKAKIESVKAETDHTPYSIVEIVNVAVPPQTPVGPDRVLGALLCAIGLFPLTGGFFLLKTSLRPSS